MSAGEAKLVSLLLRIGLAFAFLYAAIASFIEPDAWVGYLPIVLRHAVSPSILLPSFSVFEIIISLWILSGKYLFYSSLIATLMLMGIIVLNFGAMDIVFRDVAIALSAVALAVIGYKETRTGGLK